jgi:hypothetical protein
VRLAGFEGEFEGVTRVDRDRPVGAGPAQCEVADTCVPGAVRLAARCAHRVPVEVSGRSELDPYAGLRAVGGDPAQQYGAMRIARERAGFAAPEDAVAGDSPAAPDQRAPLVVAAPDVAADGGHRVVAVSSDQLADDGA